LRVLQTGEFERLGSSYTRSADVRVISATNADLRRGIAAGSFREDLFFRLNVVEVFVPPLADRPDDVLVLASHFLAAVTSAADAPPGKAGLVFGEEAATALVNHDWPGNVRELQNRVQRAVLVAAGPVVTPADLDLGEGGAPRAGRPSDGAPPAIAQSPPNPASSSNPARRSIEEALIRHGGVVAKAAAEMGISRQALHRRMERLGIVIEKRLR
jgi:DNA-binding NtrC family response regulator